MIHICHLYLAPLWNENGDLEKNMSLPSSTSPLQHLLVVLSDRNIPLTSDDVAWAFSSPQTKSDIEAWVHKYLSPDHLLTEEELKL
jgi:hypothetical protein